MQSFHDLKNFISLRKKGDSFQLFHAIFSQRLALRYREQKWAGLGIFSSLFLFQAKCFLHTFSFFPYRRRNLPGDTKPKHSHSLKRNSA